MEALRLRLFTTLLWTEIPVALRLYHAQHVVGESFSVSKLTPILVHLIGASEIEAGPVHR